MENIEKHLEFLLAAALRKCGNLQDAEDLVQETVLAALLYEAKGGHIEDTRPWLATVLGRRYYDMLRGRLSRPTVSIGDDFDVADDSDLLEDVVLADEAERLRRAVAFLVSTYREVIVRHYMNGQSVADIAAALGIPEGTVKSRLSAGRDQLRKGIDKMENYKEQSYMPVKLYVSNSGKYGLDGEPGSLVNDDLIAQNLLYLAYEKPISVAELSRAIGIPTAYTEPIVKRLVDGELMRRIGDKVYTDFIIYTVEDTEKYIPAEKNFIAENFDIIKKPYEKFYDSLRKCDAYKRLGDESRSALELFCFFNIFDHGDYVAISEAFDTWQTFPDRPNGGKWIAFGHVHRSDDQTDGSAAQKYSYAGQNNLWLTNYLGSKSVRMSLFYPTGFPIRKFWDKDRGILEENLIKLLYIIESGIDIKDSGFDDEYLKSIPHLAECKILHYEDGRPRLSVPALYGEDMAEIDPLVGDAQAELAEALKGPLEKFLKDKITKVPPHLKSVPLQKQYMYSASAMLMIALRLAMKEGIIEGGDYDSGVQPPCPMILVIEK